MLQNQVNEMNLDWMQLKWELKREGKARSETARRLGIPPDADLPRYFVSLFDDPDEDVRWGAHHALVALGDLCAVPSLIELLGHSDMHTRAIAASALGKLGSTEPVDPLVELFNDRNAGIRDTSRPQEHIQTDRDREANPDCLNALDRAWAAEALGRLGDMRAFQPLMNAADDPIGGVRACAVGALGALGDFWGL